jgi:hypothetical protein
VSREDLPYLLPPGTGFPAAADEALQRRVETAFQAKLLAGDLGAALAVAEAVLAGNPGFAPADVLRAQALLVRRDLPGARAILDPVVARYPDYTAALLAAARAADLAVDPVTAYAHLRRLAQTLPIALERAGSLHPAAVAAMAAQVEDAVGRGRLDEARERLATLREWAPSDPATLEATMGLARAANDPRGELEAVRTLLTGSGAGDDALLERRGELELAVGQPAAAIDIFSALQRRHPDEPRYGEQVDRAKFRWRVTNLPADVSRLVEVPELTRAEFAVLLYWLVPGVRAAVVSEPHIASDILEHPRRQEIMRVVNLSLMDLDEALRRFNPDWRVHRAAALRALERVLQRGQPQPSCVADLEGNPAPSREAVCSTAAACGLLTEAAECLPEAGVAGNEAAAWIHRTVTLLP